MWVNQVTHLPTVREILLQTGLLSKCLRSFRTTFQMVRPHTPMESGSATFLELVPIQLGPLEVLTRSVSVHPEEVCCYKLYKQGSCTSVMNVNYVKDLHSVYHSYYSNSTQLVHMAERKAAEYTRQLNLPS